jgi:hypothetical protein
MYGFDIENACGYVSESIFIEINVTSLIDLPEKIEL